MTDETQGGAEAPVDDTPLAPTNQVDAAATDTTDDLGDDPAAQTADEGEGAQPKPKKSARERIDELTWRVRESERREQELLDRIARQQPAPAQEAQPTSPDSDEPDPEDYEHGINDLGYIKAVARFEARQEFRQQAEQDRAKQSIRSRITAFETKVADQFPDGDSAGITTFRAQAGQLHIAVQEIITESDVGPKVADYLGSNPRELRRISALPPAQQVRQVTLLEAKLTAPVVVQAKTATDAPEPPPRPRGTGGQFKVAPDTDDFAAFEKQYGKI